MKKFDQFKDERTLLLFCEHNNNSYMFQIEEKDNNILSMKGPKIVNEMDEVDREADYYVDKGVLTTRFDYNGLSYIVSLHDKDRKLDLNFSVSEDTKDWEPWEPLNLYNDKESFEITLLYKGGSYELIFMEDNGFVKTELIYNGNCDEETDDVIYANFRYKSPDPDGISDLRIHEFWIENRDGELEAFLNCPMPKPFLTYGRSSN